MFKPVSLEGIGLNSFCLEINFIMKKDEGGIFGSFHHMIDTDRKVSKK